MTCLCLEPPLLLLLLLLVAPAVGGGGRRERQRGRGWNLWQMIFKINIDHMICWGWAQRTCNKKKKNQLHDHLMTSSPVLKTTLFVNLSHYNLWGCLLPPVTILLLFLIYSLHAPTSCLLFFVYILISFYRLSFLSCTALLFMHSLMHSPAQSAY